jgi:hypothetical protein
VVHRGRKFGKAIWDITGKGVNVDMVFEHPGEATFPVSTFVCKKGGMVVICAGTTGFNCTFDVRYMWMHQKRCRAATFRHLKQAAAANKLMIERRSTPACPRSSRGLRPAPKAHMKMLIFPQRAQAGQHGGAGAGRRARGLRIVYTPVYAPEFQKIADWLAGQGPKPAEGKLDAQALDRAHAFFARTPSIPGALAAAGLRGSDFITGWTRRNAPLDIALVDEASMLDDAQFKDLQHLFSTVILFGDPAQLAPVGQRGAMVFDGLAAPRRLALHRIHRQAADNPILDLAHALGDPAIDFRPLRGTCG